MYCSKITPTWKEPPIVWCEKGQWWVRPEGTFIPFKCSKSLAMLWKSKIVK